MEVAAATISILAAFLPALIWLWMFTREDHNPEPKGVIFRAFIAGALMTAPTLAIQLGGGSLGIPLVGVVGMIFLAAIEELTKFFGAFFSVRRDRAFDEPVDAMVYMIAAGLGFATVENVLSVISGAGSVFSVPAVFESLALRFVGATLLHTLAAALVGYAWAKGIQKGKPAVGIITGLIIGTAVHAVFNLLLSEFQAISVLAPTAFLIVVAFFVFRDFDLIQRQ